MLKLLPAALLILAASCNNEEKSNTSTTDSSTISTPSASETVPAADSTIQGCYSLISGQDTSSLQLSINNKTATGSLSYNISGKDRNDGTFTGEINGDQVEVWYLFRSEGMMSVRQEVWKIMPDKLVPATGEVTVRNDSAMFRDKTKLTFDEKRAFTKVKCLL